MYSYTGTYVCMYVSAHMRTCVHALGMYVTHAFSDCMYITHIW